ncbi:MAG: DNA mismatch repair protein MutS, partial [Pseudomonadota bacterium]
MSAIWLEQSASGKDNAAGGAIASIDLSTGEVRLGAAPLAELVSELERLAPREVLLPEETRQRSMAAPGETAGTAALEMIASTCAALGALQTPVAAVQFDARRGGESLCRQYDVREVDSLADAGRPFDDGELAAMHAALSYISLTQVGRTPQLRRPVRISGEGNLVIDAATRRNLELERTAQGDKMGCLLWAIDRTVTPAGGRAMAAVLREPLCNQAAIIDRLDAVEFLLREAGIRDDVRTALRGLPDVARALSRLALQRGAPRDLGQLRAALRQARTVGALFAERAAGDPASTPDQIARAAGPCTWLTAPPSNDAHPVAELLSQLDEALNETLPAARRDGNFIRPGHNSELDELRSMRDDARQVIATLETRYRDQSTVKSLKIKYNNQLGYFIEVTPAHAQTMLGADPAFGFQHRQTLVSAVRFMTEELASLEGRITAASERALTLEGELFNALVAQALTVAEHLTKLADGLAALDVFAGLAQVAHEENYIRPHIDNGASLEISLGRHPVVEQAMRRG